MKQNEIRNYSVCWLIELFTDTKDDIALPKKTSIFSKLSKQNITLI